MWGRDARRRGGVYGKSVARSLLLATIPVINLPQHIQRLLLAADVVEYGSHTGSGSLVSQFLPRAGLVQGCDNIALAAATSLRAA